ncbi:LAETG motif-containing sortase-dependent surface protein [Streptomyces viridochromogenes]|uniref:LAETG motif-containing sortase-dependent surface protein n=1 Tax=Streptomyces viridochromogenes TaxID=1938 RepID=UPI00069F1FFA|nr:LAETG motif-containing sortase-dependent surface protein [Streptomyces viridochromogenes]KOG19455.1 LPXTG-motif cell wall anchor domain-containing protein [Streptomyces viridochromogenes]KOG19953.1 LPXTG-motif cell wall anchor domain-containing protein [Streptomyces viridochromogenes]
MKLRRALAAAATTAVIAPIALLSAPVAFATDDETPAPTVSESTSAPETPDPTNEETTPATDEPTSTEDPTAPATEEPTSTEDPTAPATEEPTPTEEPTSSTSPSPSASESAPEEEVDFCEDADDESVGLSEDLHSGLSGLPETIVAGSGWTNFSFDVSNSGDQDIKNIKPLIGVAAVGWDEVDYSGQIKVQVFNKETGSWQTLADAAGEGATFTAFALDAGQSTSFKLRLSVSGKVPDAIGITGGFAQYSDADGCWLADDPNGWVYFFDILAAGSDPGDPDDAKPQTGGQKPISNVSEVDVDGSLAETGSSSGLPIIATVGGVAIVAGAGVMFAMKRRRIGAAA